MKVVRGKLVTLHNGEQKFFPALSRGPLGALDAAPERDDDTDPKREAALDAREAAIDWREAAGDEGKDDEEARDRKRARDASAIARDRRAHDRRASGAGDEEPSREEAYRQARDSEVDHRNDFAPIAAGGPGGRSADSRRGMACDARAIETRRITDLDHIFRVPNT